MKKNFWIVVGDIIKKADVVLEILDARMPDITRSERLEQYVKKHNKPLILIIHKSDLISKSALEKIRSRYHGMDYAITTKKSSHWMNSLVGLIKSKAKKKDIKVGVVGYPNTGKSTFINKLSRSGRARTSSESGFTKGIQFISGIGGLMFFDSPGVVPFEDRDEVRLGLVSGISPTKLSDPELVAYALINIFIENNPDALSQTYGIDPNCDADDVMSEIGLKKNLLIKGGLADERRVAIQLLTDWHSGKIRL